MRTDDDLIQDEVADALARSAEELSDASRNAIRRRVMRAVRHDSRAHFLAATSHRIAAVATGIAVLSGGVAYAAGNSLPGDALYAIKRASEDALVAILPPGALERRVLLVMAERRAHEAAQLASEGATRAMIESSLSELRDAVDAAVSANGALATEEMQRIQDQAQDAPQQTREAISNTIEPAPAAPLGPSDEPDIIGEPPTGDTGGTGETGGTGGTSGTYGTGGTGGTDGSKAP